MVYGPVVLTAYIFSFRWVLWLAGGVFLMDWICFRRIQCWKFQDSDEGFPFFKTLIALCGGFFALALLGKASQYWTLGLSAQDFWLFVDILEQGKKGAFLLTRFAPQSLGFVQHGIIHPMLTWALLVPLAKWIGSVPVALLYNPAVLAGAGWMVAVLAKPQWGSRSALVFAAAFLASTQVGKVLMYEVHPEAAYPFLLLLWFWSLQLHTRLQVKWVGVVLSVLLCAGIKEDSVFVLAPWILVGVIGFTGARRRAVALSGAVLVFVLFLQMWAVKGWSSGNLGPSNWQGAPVVVEVSLSALKGGRWEGLTSGWKILSHLIADGGGIVRILIGFFQFLISRPWLSLLILAPWVALNRWFWVSILPLALVYSMLPGPRVLWNYYSAPFLGAFWFCAMMRVGFGSRRVDSAKNYFPYFALGSSLILGSGSIQFFWPSNWVQAVRAETRRLLEPGPNFLGPDLNGKGLVASHLIGLVPLERVLTDRIPSASDSQFWNQIDFVLISPNLGRFEMSQESAKQLFEQLSRSPDWEKKGEFETFAWFLRKKRIHASFDFHE